MASLNLGDQVVWVWSGAAVSNFRLTEVQYATAAGLDRIEITNLGAVPGDLGRYRLSVAGGASVSVPLTSLPVNPGQRVTVHVGPASTLLTDPNQLVDFVQWGAGGGPNEVTAIAANDWLAGTFVDGVDNTAYSITFCGTGEERGFSFWDVATANFGSGAIYSTPTSNATWGRLKQIYR